jgi:ubiquinone/menaquinone biosynthesis C-methylase UbiE
MLSFRREHLDKYLNQHANMMTGKVLDIGGYKANKRGKFSPPIKGILSWEYLNSDSSKEPDYCCNAKSIPLENESINTIIITEVIQYIPDIDEVIQELYRILAKGGYCIVSSPFMSPIHGDYQDDRVRYTPIMLHEIFSKYKFKVLKILPMGSVGSVIYDIFRVNYGYASGKKEKKIRSKLLYFSRHLFRWIDNKTQRQSMYINTGYFIVLEK